MSDLISRKKISGYIKMIINPYGKPFEGTAYELGLKIMRYIDAMDSAYSIDEVVNELEEIKDKYDHSCIDNVYQRGVETGAKWMKKKAIEIVKQGGVGKEVE